ncbi:MAG TPA: addiction module protein [Thermomicrobiales bacterium]|jgi:putative addiction module component (TIGR02574 family)|nr:addiction module protein [Thermomicrobiales bacterium]
MAMTALRDEILKLSVVERLQLVEEIWDSLTEEASDMPLSDELKRELDRRLALHRANPESAIPWEHVRAELEAEG